MAYSYSAQNDDELDLEVGEIIYGLREVEDGWWEGHKKSKEDGVTGKLGVFPSNFVKVGQLSFLRGLVCPSGSWSIGLPVTQTLKSRSSAGFWRIHFLYLKWVRSYQGCMYLHGLSFSSKRLQIYFFSIWHLASLFFDVGDALVFFFHRGKLNSYQCNMAYFCEWQPLAVAVKINKAGYTATLVAWWWSGAVL